jgi:hypothetical protein
LAEGWEVRKAIKLLKIISESERAVIGCDDIDEVIESLKDALAQQEKPEPFAWLYHDAKDLATLKQNEENRLQLNSVMFSIKRGLAHYSNETALYTQPPRREWVGLTSECREELAYQFNIDNWMNQN